MKIKKSLGFILTLCLAVTAVSGVFITAKADDPSVTINGDMDGDGELTAMDLTLLARKVAGIDGEETDSDDTKPEQIGVDFTILCAQYPDVVGYIYATDTDISYPIVQGEDDEFYLKHDYKGDLNNNGAIFMDSHCNGDFSSGNSIIYGHNMKSGLMFAHLLNYKNQNYYDEHPFFYIYTPTKNYRLELFAGCVVPGDADIYALYPSADTIAALVSESTFQSKITTPTGKIVTLSTVDYSYNNARYVVLGQLVPID